MFVSNFVATVLTHYENTLLWQEHVTMPIRIQSFSNSVFSKVLLLLMAASISEIYKISCK